MHCCEAFSGAMQSGTDNEGYGKLIDLDRDVYTIGPTLPPLRFCPWCGADKTKKHPLEVAARRAVESLDEHKDWHELKRAIGELACVLNSLTPTKGE